MENNTNTQETTNIETKTFTEEQVNELINTKLQEQQKLFKQEQAEAEKLKNLGEEERRKALLNKQIEEFEKERKTFEREKLKVEVSKQLVQENLNTNFTDFLLGESAEDCNKNIKNFKEVWQKALDEAINKKLGDNTIPKLGNTQEKAQGTNDFCNIINQFSRN